VWVNYYEHHIGDYDKKTSHLTACEDGIYCRMLRRYYDTEAPLVADVTELKRKVRARTKEEKLAVDAVLAEFFFLEADGWHQKNCDEVIDSYRKKEPEREAKKTNEELRLQRHREERASLFSQLNAVGQHAPYNTPMKDLRALVAQHCGGSSTETATPPATAPATLATAIQSPAPTPAPVTRDIAITTPPAAPTASPSPTPAPQKAAKKPSAEAQRGVAALVADGLTEQTATEWLAYRKRKKADLTPRAWQGFKSEADKAAWTYEAAVVKAMARGWTGFEADWVKGESMQSGETPYQRSQRELVEQATGGLVSRRNPATPPPEGFDARTPAIALD
jgi:uncharacterized protein YdaU (DUF1376 family)